MVINRTNSEPEASCTALEMKTTSTEPNYQILPTLACPVQCSPKSEQYQLYPT